MFYQNSAQGQLMHAECLSRLVVTARGAVYQFEEVQDANVLKSCSEICRLHRYSISWSQTGSGLLESRMLSSRATCTGSSFDLLFVVRECKISCEKAHKPWYLGLSGVSAFVIFDLVCVSLMFSIQKRSLYRADLATGGSWSKSPMKTTLYPPKYSHSLPL